MNLQKILSEGYNLKDCTVTPQQGGWTSLAYKVENKTGFYFLKVYEKERKSTAKWTALIDDYIPIIIWLNDNFLKGSIIEPLLTADNSYKYEDESVICLLFKYIEGETIGEKSLNPKQIEEFAGIISELHSHGEDIPFPKESITENFDLSFTRELVSFLETESADTEIKAMVSPYDEKIREIIKKTTDIQDRIRQKEIPFVLTHNDIHQWNLMQSKNGLVLIDWEGLKYAPRESDLYTLVNEPYFAQFMSIYKEKHFGYVIDKDLINFYQSRRKLEDIWEFIELLITPELKMSLKNENLKGLQNELLSLSEFVGW